MFDLGVRPPESDRDAVLILAHCRDGEAAFHGDSKPAEMAGKQALRLALRQTQMGIGQVGKGRDAHVLPDLQRARHDAYGPAIREWEGELIDGPRQGG